MSMFSNMKSGARNLTGRAEVEAELDEELRTYADLLIAQNIKDGMSPEEARRAAMAKIGSIEYVKDEVRDVRPGMKLENFARDLKHGVRLMRRSPGFAIIAVLTIALGIGATSAIFSVINAVALKPLAYPNSEQLLFMTSAFPRQGFDKFWISPPEYFELRERAKSYTSVAAYRATEVNVSEGTQPQRVKALAVTANMFDVLGVQPRLGRAFTPEQDLPNVEPVVIISDNLWRNTFASDPSIVGKQIDVQGRKRLVVGVAPPGLDLHDTHADVWIPMGLDPNNRQNRGSHYLYLVSRLKPSVTVAQAHNELNAMIREWGTLTPGTMHVPNDSTHRIQFTPLRDEVVGNVARSLWILQGAVVLVLLIACANVANLLLVRAEGRHKEFAIRTALGAGRSTILRQFMAEGLVLTAVGSALGLVLARTGLTALLAANPDSIPRSAEITVDPRVLVFTMVIALLTATVFGLAPLLHLGQKAIATAIREGGTRSTSSTARHKVRRSLVAGEIMLAVILVIGAGLLLKSFSKLTNVDAGFDERNLTTFGVYLPAATYASPEQRAQFASNLIRTLEKTQGVQSVSAMTGMPPNRQVNANDTDFENVPTGPTEPSQNVDYYNETSAKYFDTMKIPMVEGRAFTEGDAIGSPVAIINETTAKKFYKNASPIGRRIRVSGPDSAPWFTIVGVAKDVKQGGLDQKPGTELYFNYDQEPRIAADAPNSFNFVIRATRTTESLAPTIQTAVRSMDPTLPVVQLRSMESVFGASVSRQHFLSLLLGIFAAVALTLAAIGTYGVLSYLVTERQREIGIRVALGASTGGIVKLVVRQGMSIAGAGLALGVVGAFALARVTRSLLFDVSPTDPVIYATVALSMVVVALLACLIPAQRAMRVDPLVAIRSD